MSAAARAEARRKAILSRGGDRLARLTSSARGEDASAYMHDDPPLAPLPDRPTLERLVGEQTDLPTPTATAAAPRDSRQRTRPQQVRPPPARPPNGGVPETSSPDETMRQLREALAAAGPLPSLPGASSEGDPLAAMMANFAQAGNMPGMTSEKAVMTKPKTRLQKLLPFLHLIAGWALLAYFILWQEPQAYEAQTHGSGSDRFWRRWAELGWRGPEDWGVQPVPFFWAFTTLALILHSWRIFSKLDVPQPPMLLALALPHLPPPLPSLVTNGLAYLKIGSVFLDDIAGLLCMAETIYGKTAAAPVFGRSLPKNGSSNVVFLKAFGVGGSTTGSPAAARSFFHRSHGDPPPRSMSSWKMADDHFWSMLRIRDVPSPAMHMPRIPRISRQTVDKGYERTELDHHLWLPLVLRGPRQLIHSNLHVRVGEAHEDVHLVPQKHMSAPRPEVVIPLCIPLRARGVLWLSAAWSVSLTASVFSSGWMFFGSGALSLGLSASDVLWSHRPSALIHSPLLSILPNFASQNLPVPGTLKRPLLQHNVANVQDDHMLGVASNIYVVSLPHRTDRRAAMERLKQALELDWTYVDAVPSGDPSIVDVLERVRRTRFPPGELQDDLPQQFAWPDILEIDALVHSSMPLDLAGSDIWAKSPDDTNFFSDSSVWPPNKRGLEQSLDDLDGILEAHLPETAFGPDIAPLTLLLRTRSPLPRVEMPWLLHTILCRAALASC
ncbi:hypothetical protein POSPLADRAFT_1043129 [Postia placenta MAD-698-R-SB12]|uniref:Uncharacterized protein n=1 Tax=Postia placenta MAD-698-R-SB12 TaxID=670580 RepID=A0A1X6NHD6_9APHY|nr:hypothetical protein POSPLADRAFT_1043129 [Postia placenta MAD-698-R-SB12]OSX67952.1 hypothetical protein POSPLADRAFT_1043129 [Postia placenta MAD-698-R-SB12]